MAGKQGLFKKLKERLFGKHHDIKDSGDLPPDSPKVSERSTSVQTDDKKLRSKAREPIFIQIGFDLGTSYSKCVCRDVITDKAWVHLPPGLQEQKMPFLIPSTVLLQNGKFEHLQDPSIEYHRNGLNHIKLALEKVALQKWDAPVLRPYIEAGRDFNTKRLTGFVTACGVYLLAGAMGEVRRDIRKRFPDYGSKPQDYMAVNLAIPVADAERPDVNALYQQVLINSWTLADQIGGYPKISPKEVKELISQCKINQSPDLIESCFLYPEVSANVQGFVRSRVSRPGIYLFSDTGAGSVEQSVFIFYRNDGLEHLTYLHGSVLPMGSSRIEYIAASYSGNLDWQNLEMWRKKKESGGTETELKKARSKIENELSRGTQTTLAWAKKKLYVEKQLYDIRLIFGGGGHCTHPYMTGVKQPFSGCLFPGGISPSSVGLPIPRDLEVGEEGNRWIHRLYVAYGLSFVRAELANFTYPKDVTDPEPDEIWNRDKKIPDAPTKDVC